MALAHLSGAWTRILVLPLCAGARPGPLWWPGSGPQHHPVQSAPLHPSRPSQRPPGHPSGGRPPPIVLRARGHAHFETWGSSPGTDPGGPWGSGVSPPAHRGCRGRGAEAPQGDGHLCSQGQNEEDRLPVHALQLGPLRVEARLQPAPLAGRVWHHPGGKAGQSCVRACWAARLATHPPVSPSFCWQS